MTGDIKGAQVTIDLVKNGMGSTQAVDPVTLYEKWRYGSIWDYEIRPPVIYRSGRQIVAGDEGPVRSRSGDPLEKGGDSAGPRSHGDPGQSGIVGVSSS